MARRYFPSSSSRGRRRSLLRNQIADLILSGFLVTTEARAKTLKVGVERLISRTKSLDLAARRRVLAFLPKKPAAKKLLEQIVPQFKDRVGGYVRVVKLPPRRGDNAPMARVEFVEEITGGATSAEEKKRARPPVGRGEVQKGKLGTAKKGKGDKKSKAKGKVGAKKPK